MSETAFQITSGVIKEPNILMIHGVPKIGKSYFAGQFPNPVFDDIERGTKHLNVNRLPFVEQYPDVLAHIEYLRNGPHEFKTYVLDGVEKLEAIMDHHVLSERHTDEKGRDVSHVQDYGWGKGFDYVAELWDELFDKLKDLKANREIECLLLGHSEIKTEEDIVAGGSYKQFVLQVRKASAKVIRYHSDAILFATREVLIEKDKHGKVTSANIEGRGKRILYTEYSPQWDAGNRLGLPYQLKLDYQIFKDAVENGDPDSVDAIKQSIEGLITRIKKEATKEKAIKRLEEYGSDVHKLTRLRDHLLTIVEEKEN